MRTLALLATVLLLPIPSIATAGMHGHGIPALNCANYAGDNGCAASQAYVTTPSVQDTSFAVNSAQSGQSIVGRNSLIHQAGVNLPYIDYSIGSASPAILPAVSSYVDGTGTCVYATTGAPFGNGPVLTCQGVSAQAGNTVAIPALDFTNTGSGTGTDCAELQFKNTGSGSGAGINYTVTGSYFKASGTCFAGTGGAPAALIILKSAGSGTTPNDVRFRNLTIDGNFAGAPDAAAGRIVGVEDDRNGAATPFAWPLDLEYTVFENLGHDPVFGKNGGNVTGHYNAVLGACLSGPSLCHGEFAELTAANNTTRTDDYTGNLIFVPAFQTTSQWTAAFYPSSGVTNNLGFTAVTLSNNVVVFNNTGCVNAGPYSSGNPCSGGVPNGNGLFSIQQANSVGTLTIDGNVIDATGAFFCYAIPNISSVLTTGNVASPGTVFTVTSAPSNYSNAASTPSNNLNVGMLVADTNLADNFVSSPITALGSVSPSYTNTGTKCVTNAGVAGGAGGAGCGSVTLNDTQPQIVTAAANFAVYPGVTTGVYGTHNYSIASGTARQITFGAQPWGQVVCP